MRRTIRIAKSGNAFGIQFDFSGWRRELAIVGIGAKVAQEYVVLVPARQFEKAFGPERVEVRGRGFVGAQSFAPVLIKMSKPRHLVAVRRIGLFAAETLSQCTEDRIVAPRFANRSDRLLHG